MLRVPTSRKRKRPEEKLNFVPIMDSVFIFIFFLLMSASFLKIYGIGSPIPLISDSEPPKEEKEPLALSLNVAAEELTLSQGVPAKIVKKFTKQADGEFNYEELHTVLINFKKQYSDEDTILFEPVGDVTYEQLVKVMDAVRSFSKTDDAVFKKNKEGLEEKVTNLFDKIIFSNLMTEG